MGRIKRKIIRIVCIALIACILIVNWVIYRSFIEKNSGFVDSTIALMSIAVAFWSVSLITKQLNQSKVIEEAEFILHLNQAFAENSVYAEVYEELEKSRKENRAAKLTRADISSYLTFFETVYILLSQKAINIKNLDDLFEYRFFLAIHDKTIQKEKLVESPYNFRNIYYLEKVWTQYRKDRKFQIYHEEDCLYNACIIAGKETVYRELMSYLERKKRR